MTDREVMQQALEALIDAANVLSAPMFANAVDALRTALKQPEQQATYWQAEAERYASNTDYWRKRCKAAEQQAEPVAYIHRKGNFREVSEHPLLGGENARGWTEEPLYAAPAQRPWVKLTDEDWEHIHDRKETALDTFAQGAVWAEAQLRERNT